MRPRRPVPLPAWLFVAALLAFSMPAGRAAAQSGGGVGPAMPFPRSLEYTNAASITIQDATAASPYPSTITVGSFALPVAAVTVTLNGFSHTRPSDVDILLVGPTGAKAMLISDVGGSTAVAGLTIVLDSALDNFTTAALTSDRYAPTNLNDGGSDAFPTPAPSGTATPSLYGFAGLDPVGTWSLYVSDDAAGEAGSISGGWSLTLHALSWTDTASMAQQRVGSPLNLLPDGRAFVASAATFGAGASEYFDPHSGVWVTTGSTPAGNGRSVVLPTGKVLVVGATSSSLFDPALNTWTVTGGITPARPTFGCTATVLRDGRVLFAGQQAQPELYDPASGTWTLGNAMSAARTNHTAVLLQDGRVLVAGGTIASATTAAAEIFDPSTGTWTATDPMSVPRRSHSATVLANGQVLVAGGSSTTFASVASSELYDPGTGDWLPTGSLRVRRQSHATALLPDGRVMATGGYWQGQGVMLSTEVYTPATGTWTEDGVMSNYRGNAPVTVLSTGQVLIAGGGDGGGAQGSAEVYTPFSDNWTSAGTVPSATYASTMTLLPDGRVVVLGGASAVTRIFDPGTGWSTGTAAPAALDSQQATLLRDGRILVTGGDIAGDPVKTAYLYDPTGNAWTAAPEMTGARMNHGATLLADGRVMVSGGNGDGFGFIALKTAEIYDPAANTWTATGSTANGHQYHPAVLLADGRVLVVAGFDGGVSGRVEVWNPQSGTWSVAGSLNTARWGAAGTLLPDGRVLVVSGSDTAGFDGLATTEIFDPDTNAWSPGPDLGTARFRASALLLRTGQVLVAGGYVDGTRTNTTEVLDFTRGRWEYGPLLVSVRDNHNTVQLFDGRVLVAGGLPTTSETIRLEPPPNGRTPAITGAGPDIAFGAPFTVMGTGFRGDSEAVLSASNVPVVSIQSLASGRLLSLRPDSMTSFGDDPMTLAFSALPSSLDVGWHRVTVTTNGLPSAAAVVRMDCSLAVTTPPQDIEVPLGQSALFSVATQGGRLFQWERDAGLGFQAISGATGSSYSTPPVTGADSGSQYRVVVTGACGSTTSSAATLAVQDAASPDVDVVSPSGGEYWTLSTATAEETRVVTWSMSDDVRICKVEGDLLFSGNGGASYARVPAAANLAPAEPDGTASYGPGGACTFTSQATDTSLTYTVPTTFPSGTAGSLYKVEVRVTDHAGNETVARSTGAFYIVQANPDSVRTLILSKLSRMSGSTAELASKLQELAGHPRVQGLVVDLDGNTDVNALYADWDADPSSAARANAVLFGCHADVPVGCGADRDGIHDTLRELLDAYTGVRYLVIVGDDSVIPFARLQDGTALLPESTYPSATPGGNISSTGTTVGRALFGGSYLSDDPLTSADGLDVGQLAGTLFIPDLAVSRLVETPAEIVGSIATFIGQDGVLDLSLLDPDDGHKALVTGYDFLIDSAKQVRRRWKGVLTCAGLVDAALVACLADDDDQAPVDGHLVGTDWDLGSVGQRVDALRDALDGHGSARYAIGSLSGHATHYEEGVPGTDPFNIDGLGTIDIYGDEPLVCAPPSTSLGALDLAGAVVYAVGCHGGLPVTGSCYADPDHSLDLPQTMMSRGVVAYVANTGYGWGLKYGIGYSERLMELFTEELTSGGTVVVGDAVKQAKQRYFLETPRYDSYDEKSLMQWTLFGLPMYAIKTGLTASAPAFAGPAPSAGERPAFERFGAVAVERAIASASTAEPSGPAPNASLPAYLTQLNLSFDFSAAGVYEKHEADGDVLPDGTPGCPDAEGCYYTLNGIVQRSTGNTDLPIQPYFIYDSRLSGTSQHGVLWKGGTYDEETGWVPVIATLQSNVEIPTSHGSAPRVIKLSGIAPRLVPGADPAQCRPSELEVNSLVVDAGEAVKDEASDPSYTIERHYREIGLEVFYFNDRTTPNNNCDRTGPQIEPGPFAGAYHEAVDTTVTWAVPVCDAWPTATCDATQVWRVSVVYNDNQVDGSNRGTWVPLELTNDAGTWRGSHAFTGTSRVTYVIQAVDKRGNVTWLDFASVSTLGPLAPSPTPPDEPDSGVPLGVPATVDVDLGGAAPALAVTGLQPTLGPVGGKVTLTGSGFTQVTAVEFGSASAAFVLVSDGELRATVPIGAESGPITVSTATATAHSPSFRVTRAPLLSITDVRVSESRRTATLQVSLSAASSRTVTVTYATVDGSATAGSDYATRRGTVRFLPGVRVRTVTVPIVSDRRDEPNETFRVVLSNASNAGVARATGIVTILDDDGP